LFVVLILWWKWWYFVVLLCFFFFAGTPWTEEGSTYSTWRRKNKFSG
jgi:hypothetical protein